MYKFPMTFEYSAEDIIEVIRTFSPKDKRKVEDFLKKEKQKELIEYKEE